MGSWNGLCRITPSTFGVIINSANSIAGSIFHAFQKIMFLLLIFWKAMGLIYLSFYDMVGKCGTAVFETKTAGGIDID